MINVVKMQLEDYFIRNYEPGFEEDQVRIFNDRINDLNPNAQKITIDKVIKRCQGKNFNPKQIKFLLNKNNDIIGYVEVRILDSVHLIFYPLILKPYDKTEVIDYLFKSIYNYSVSLRPNTIMGVYNFNFHSVHDYFETQKVAKIEKK